MSLRFTTWTTRIVLISSRPRLWVYWTSWMRSANCLKDHVNTSPHQFSRNIRTTLGSWCVCVCVCVCVCACVCTSVFYLELPTFSSHLPLFPPLPLLHSLYPSINVCSLLASSQVTTQLQQEREGRRGIHRPSLCRGCVLPHCRLPGQEQRRTA